MIDFVTYHRVNFLQLRVMKMHCCKKLTILSCGSNTLHGRQNFAEFLFKIVCRQLHYTTLNLLL